MHTKTLNSVQEEDRRKFIRHPVSVPLNIEPLQNKIMQPGFDSYQDCGVNSMDVSHGGLLIHTEQPLAAGSGLTVTFPPLFDHDAEQFHGVVVRVQHDVSGGYNIGVNFTDEHEKMRIRMVEQILRIDSYRKTHNIPSFDQAAAEWIQKYSAHFPRI